MAERGQFRPASATMPVRWDAGRDARGKSPDRGTYKCPVKGCPVVAVTLRAIVAHARRHRDEDVPAPAASHWGIQVVIPPPGEHRD